MTIMLIAIAMTKVTSRPNCRLNRHTLVKARAAGSSHRRVMNGLSATGHRGEKRDFTGTFELGLVGHMMLIEGGATPRVVAVGHITTAPLAAMSCAVTEACRERSVAAG